MFVTFEGPNGVGKTTILGGVGDRLLVMGFDVVQTKEPTASLLGDFLRVSEDAFSGKCLACLAAADRYYHVEREIVPALSSGKIVLSGRYVESSLVLQGLDGCDFDFVWGLNILEPDHHPHYSFFEGWEYAFYKDLSRYHLGDAFRYLHPLIREYSWVGRTGNGYRYDHCFVSDGLLPKVKKCFYLHEPRKLRLSDHSAIITEIGLDNR